MGECIPCGDRRLFIVLNNLAFCVTWLIKWISGRLCGTSRTRCAVPVPLLSSAVAHTIHLIVITSYERFSAVRRQASRIKSLFTTPLELVLIYFTPNLSRCRDRRTKFLKSEAIRTSVATYRCRKTSMILVTDDPGLSVHVAGQYLELRLNYVQVMLLHTLQFIGGSYASFVGASTLNQGQSMNPSSP
jgi:hypothetical protein